jgi:hypothetical protein
MSTALNLNSEDGSTLASMREQQHWPSLVISSTLASGLCTPATTLSTRIACHVLPIEVVNG